MGLTSSGPWCDVGGEPTMLEPIQFFTVHGMEHKLLTCERHGKAVLEAGSDWKALPEGPLRRAFEGADKETDDGTT